MSGNYSKPRCEYLDDADAGYMYMPDWFRFLRSRGVIDIDTMYGLLRDYLSSNSKIGVSATETAYAMKRDHPDLWLVFKTRQRVLGRV